MGPYAKKELCKTLGAPALALINCKPLILPTPTAVEQMGGVLRQQKMLKDHLPRVIYHRVY